MLEHGGRLRAAAREHGIPLAAWLDLSTGINPCGYPVPPLDPAAWQRLPEDDDGLDEVAAAYYGNANLLALPGSQAAIARLPACFAPAAVACLAPLYEEHPQAWAQAGHKLRRLPEGGLARALTAMTPVVVLCNPNNPTGRRLARAELLDAAAQLKRRGGWLVVDEAFADDRPDDCVAPFAGTPAAPNLIVLRSLGKFFGLAGARVGFAFGASEKLARLRATLGPWPISGPARAAARLALADRAWQAATRAGLTAAGERLAALLAPLDAASGNGGVRGCALFATLATPHADALHAHLARHAILVRRFPEHGLLRFGLPGDEAGWQRLAAALDLWTPPC